MQLSTKGRYSIRAMCRLANSYKKKSISLSEISKKEGISLDYLEQLFNKLKKEKLVQSIRGSRGGYILAREPKKISMGEIIKAVGEKVQIENCAAKSCEKINDCPSRTLWQEMDQKISQTLNTITLADLIKNKVIK
jgi:Rrf2 family iron-sulfur cluster assembly transcriptional regulator